MGPVQIRVRDNLVRRWRTPARLVFRRVSVTYERGVVTPDERAMES